MSVPLGGFEFTVGADVSPAQRSIQQLVQRAQQAGRQVETAFGGQIRPDIRTAEQAYQRLRQVAEQATRSTATIRPQVDTRQAEAGFERLGRAARAASERAAAITVRADVSEAQHGLETLVGRARAVANTRINLTANVNGIRQTEQAVERMARALRNARAGETINLNVRAESVERADLAVKRLEADINRAKAAGARVNVNVVTNQQGRGFAGQVAGGFIQQATPGLATGAAAAVGVIAAQQLQATTSALTQAMTAGIQTGIRYNAALEQSSVQLGVFLGSAEASTEALRRLQRIAEQTPFSFNEISQAAASFAQVAGGNIDRLERLVELATQLAAVNPQEGIGGATFALREALSGDFTSIVERFRVSRADIQQIRQLGLSGEELAAALVKAAGGSKQLSDAMSETFEGRVAKASEIIDKLAGAASKPLFGALSTSLKEFIDLFDRNASKIERLAAILGAVPVRGAQALIAAGGNVPVAVAVAASGPPISRAAPTPPPESLSPGEQQRQARIAAAQREADAARAAHQKQLDDIKKIEQQLEANARAAREITERYEEQLRPLEAQRRLLDAQIQANQAQGREIAARARAAEGPVEARAQNAAAAVLLDHERQLLEIRHRRAEISEQLAEAEQAAANRAAEAAIRAAETALNAARQRAQAEREARQEVLEGLREEIRGRQEARQAALEGMREYIQAIQEARREALDAIREEIAARQEARREAIDGLREQIEERRRVYDVDREGVQEARQAAQEAFAEQERLAERAHSRSQERYADQIQALRDQLDVRREQSAAQQELAAFERAENARQRAQTIASAERNVLQARTGRARADALQRLAEIRAQATADAKREEIQERIRREQEAEARRREAIQQKIAELERKARQEDREYQRDRDARREAFEAQQRAQQAADRAEEKAERERRRAEDAQVRALEKADREATKREQAEIRAAEKADREQTKAENAAIRAAEQAARAQDRAEQAQLREAERAAREADRAAERELREQERAVAAQREELQARLAAQEEERAVAALGRLREQSELEKRILDNRQRTLELIDIRQKAQAEFDRILNEEEKRRLDDRKAALDDQYNTIVRNRDAALAGLDEERDKLTIAKDRAVELADQMKRAADEADKAAKAIAAALTGSIADTRSADEGPHEGGRAGFPGYETPIQKFIQGITAAVETAKTKFNELGASVGTSISEGLGAFFSSDTSTADSVTDWTQQQIVDPVEDLLEIDSPSELAKRWAKLTAEGYVLGLQQHERAIVDALEAPFIEVDQRFWPEVERKWKQAGTDHAKAYVTGFKAERIQDDIEKCIDDVLRRIERNDPDFKRAGGRAAREFAEGWCDLLNLRDCFAREMEWMVDNARAYGTQVGANFSTGFGQTAAPATGGGAGTGTHWDTVPPGPGNSCPPGYQYFANLRACVRVDSQGHPVNVPNSPGGGGRQILQRRAAGGYLGPEQWALVGEQGPEMIRLRQAGTVIPHALTMSTLAGGGLVSASSRGAVSVSLNQTIHAAPGMDVQALAQVVTTQAVAAIIDVLDDGERRAPDPIPRILPGAVRG